MMRIFTLVENRQENGNVDYQVSGDLPLTDVARALILIAMNVEKPQPEKKNEESGS